MIMKLSIMMNDLFVCYSIFPLFIFTFILHKYLSSSPKNGKNTPPSPPKLPIIGNHHQLGSLPHRTLQHLSNRYGPLMLLHFGSVPVLVASSPEAAREIMKDHDVIFSDRPKSSIPDRLFYGSKDIAFTPYGEYWRQIRSVCVLHLLSNKRVNSFHDVREEETRLMVEKIRKSHGLLINLSDILAEFTNNIISRVALGRKYGEKGGDGKKDFKLLLGETFELLGKFNVGDYTPWLAWVNKINGLDDRVDKLAKEMDEFFEGVVEEHINNWKKKEEDGLDLVDVLLDILREDMMGFPLHKDSVKALILDMFAAGTHTTYTLLEWTMAELIKNPKIMKRLQNEVRTNKHQPDKSLENNKKQYLKAVIKESLRLHIPAPLLVPRKASKDVKVLGIHVAAETEVLFNTWAIVRDPEIWEDPEEFKPERFLDSDVDYYKGMHFEFIPFGAGRRGCPGVAFALAVVELALATLVREFDFESGTGDLNMDEKYGLVVLKKTRLIVTATDVAMN